MKIVNDGENFSMHNHELNECHTFSSIVLLKVYVEDLGKGSDDDINLSLGKDLQ